MKNKKKSHEINGVVTCWQIGGRAGFSAIADQLQAEHRLIADIKSALLGLWT
jgi:hypothetical protein